ncbi:spermidine/putrescine ABC transporter substrate-binding protein [Laribacter hongkongensis]|nr:spermidine/putrescine ABC transporter substrate-binding protein [Laribacter hongkongensis]ASJ22887.1 spermidine/putrescine ABC transporter substrate-binding protein [Laribacter hongkongensis]MBE5529020.1 spermidine/putrescine ABC transporter substrate-binding protein [Laribacter hongkongensis]MCG8995952.1 spermidine/putrescine ABC transporter substrate-binding protein [Laribacter hongkongensis]MCG9010894.1 spermidine/putrescine ABC transporter substrate-binding protein [Laribacter hongkongen
MNKLVLIATLTALSGPVMAKDVLRVFNWNNEIAPETIKRFEALCQCSVQEDYYGDNEEMLAKLAAGASGYDMVVPTAYAMDILIKQGKTQPLDKAKIPNFKNLNPGYLRLNAEFDPGNRVGAPLLSSITAIGYNEQKIKELGIPTDSWAAIFDPQILARLKGKVTVMDSQRELVAAALMYLGRDPNDLSPANLKAAADVIRKAKPYWAAFNNQSYIKELTVGNIWLVHGFTNDFFQAMHDARAAKRPFTIGYNLQKEGNILGLDSLVILKGARRPDLANQFVNFLLDGKNAADVSNIMGAVNPNTAATPYFRPDIKANKVIMADPARQKLILLKEVPMKARRDLNRTWTSLKLG